MTDEHGMPQYDGMEYEELVAAAQFLWMENAKLRAQIETMWDCLFDVVQCDGCIDGDDEDGCAVRVGLRELGF